jgi:hypothetical protein
VLDVDTVLAVVRLLVVVQRARKRVAVGLSIVLLVVARLVCQSDYLSFVVLVIAILLFVMSILLLMS